MMPARLRTITAILVLLGGVVGVVAFAQEQKDSAKPVTLPPQAGAAVPALRPATSLLEARIETARQIVNEDMERLQNMGAIGSDVVAEIPVWSRRLMEDRLRLAATPADRLNAIREHRNRMIVVERILGRVAETGQGRVSDALKGRYYRLEADQLLSEAGADPAKEPPVAAPQKDAPPPPGAPSPTRGVPR